MPILQLFLTVSLLVAAGAGAETPAICVTNAAPERLLFAAETASGKRWLKPLRTGESLCTPAEPGENGTVSVFVSAEVIEGCSRLTRAGQTETLLEYHDFDNCRWAETSRDF